MLTHIMRHRWTYMTAALFTVFVAATAHGRWTTSPASPYGDQGIYLQWVEHSWATRTPIWEGHYSYVGLGHPGPVLYNIFQISRAAESVIPGDHLLEGYALGWMIACYLLVAYSCYAVSRATRNPQHGLALLAFYVAATALSFEHTVRHLGYDMFGFEIWPVYAPVLAAYLTLAMLSSGYAYACGHKKSGYALIVLSGLAFQSFMELAIPAVLLAIWPITTMLWNAQRESRQALTKKAALLFTCWTFGYGTFIVRMTQEGFDLPFRYITQILDVIDRGPQDPVATAAAFPGRLAAAWHTGPYTTAVVAALILTALIGMTRPTLRRWSLFSSICLIGGGIYLYTSTTADVHQVSPLATLPPLVLSAPLAKTFGFLSRTATTRCRWRRPLISASLCATIAAAAWLVIGGWYGPQLKPDYAFASRSTTPRAIATKLAEQYPAGSVVQIVATDQPGRTVPAGTLPPYAFELTRKGFTVCGPGPDRGLPAVPGVNNFCDRNDIDVWVNLTVDTDAAAPPGALGWGGIEPNCPTSCMVYIYPRGTFTP